MIEYYAEELVRLACAALVAALVVVWAVIVFGGVPPL